MPELPDISVYVERTAAITVGEVLRDLRIASPFLLRTVDPSAEAFRGLKVQAISRLGKRIVFEFEDDHYAVLHLMIAGRLRLKKAGAAIPRSNGLAAFDFDVGTFMLTEASKKKRASLHLVRGCDALSVFARTGLEVLTASEGAFKAALTRENHTLKRAMTDPDVLSGIGNAYSDEILFAAGLSPFKRTQSLDAAEYTRLYSSTREVLNRFTDALRREVGDGYPDRVTAFRDDMAVHGRYGKPCPQCRSPIQRIVYAENEANYCARCQTAGRLLADRSLSRLLKANWPRRLEDLER